MNQLNALRCAKKIWVKISSQRERDILQACPSPSGRRWPEGPDEGFGCGFAALCNKCVNFLFFWQVCWARELREIYCSGGL